MIETIRGVVIQLQNYNDDSAIAEVFSAEHGRVGVLVPRGNNKKAREVRHLFSALSPVELTVARRSENGLFKVKEGVFIFPLLDIPFNPTKSAIAFFVAEVLKNALRKEPADALLFSFLCESIAWLDEAKMGYANFHLVFMVGLARKLGICPELEYPGRGCYFDVQSAGFTRDSSFGKVVFSPNYTYFIIRLLRCTYQSMDGFRLNSRARNCCAEAILYYYRVHIPEFGEIKSLEVLQELFK
jgi:DNA repair protein RecO (recombination protein O)